MTRYSSLAGWQRALALAGVLLVLPLGLCLLDESNHHSADLCFVPSSACAGALVTVLVSTLFGALAASGGVMLLPVASLRPLPLRFPDPPPKSPFLL